MTLGTYGVLTLGQARAMARKHLVAVEGGGDPLEARQRESKGQTVKDLCLAYLERHAKPRKKSWKDDERRIHKYLLPVWGNLKVTAIRRTDVASLHSRIGQTHRYEANRVLELASKMSELAWRWGFVPEDHANPARGIGSFKEEKRDRWVTPEELPRLTEAIDQESNPYARAALWLYLLTGLRKSELLTARWDQVDFVRKELRLPDTKAGRAHYLPLSEPALALLSTIPRVEGNPYIIVGLKEGAHLVNISKPWRRVRKAAGVEDVRLHDLRRTVGSWLAQAGNSLHLIGRVLNHSSQSTTAIYARFAQDHVREALEAHGKRIMGIAGKGQEAEVISLTKAK
jgi:integrase